MSILYTDSVGHAPISKIKLMHVACVKPLPTSNPSPYEPHVRSEYLAAFDRHDICPFSQKQYLVNVFHASVFG